jgi:hypothetical protein
LPITGTLATLAGSEALSNKTITASPISGSTGAFTTLSASGQLSASKATDTSGASTAISDYSIKLVASQTNTVNSIGWAESTTTAAAIVGYDAGTGGAQGIRIYAGSNSSLPLVADFSSTGLAVTGFITATSYLSIIANASAENILIRGRSADNYGSIKFQSNSGLTRYGYIQSHSDFGGTLAIVADGGSRIDLDNRGILMNNSLAVTGALSCTGALSKGSGSFRIEHPLPEKSATHQLVHSFIEGPQADLIYRGKVVLIDGKASVNIDAAATMTEGTFEVLCREVQCFTTNESGWTAVRGKVTGNILTIEAKDADCTDEISWMVIGERQDPHMMETEWTDDNGKVIVEPLKPLTQSN